jgi:hypothetical protein
MGTVDWAGRVSSLDKFLLLEYNNDGFHDTGDDVCSNLTISIWWRAVQRRWSAMRRRLRRERAAVTLMVLLTLGLGEPLLCIIHCQIWLPIAFNSYFAAQHRHDHHHHPMTAGATHAGLTAAGSTHAATVASPAPADMTECQLGGGSGSVPFHVPPSPVHDMIPALAVLSLVPLLIRAYLTAPPGDPPRIFLPPRLRPPIFLSA